MFSGLVQAVGSVAATRRSAGGLRLRIRAPFRAVAAGESIAVDGACLTVVARGPGWFEVQVVATSLARTSFSGYRKGRAVNLERALRAGDRLGGHLVQGHVDGIARVARIGRQQDARVIDLSVPAAVARVSVPLGSVTLDGVSLTVIARPSARTVRVSLIPYTLEHTTLGRLDVGDTVHVEGDVIGKYVETLLARRPRTKRRA